MMCLQCGMRPVDARICKPCVGHLISEKEQWALACGEQTERAMRAQADLAAMLEDRDAYQRRFRDVQREHDALQNDLLEALDLEIDEDGEFFLDQIVTAARTARTDLAAMTALAEARGEALEWYANRDNYFMEELYSDDPRLAAKGVTYKSRPIMDDEGERARAALAERAPAGAGET